MQGAVALTLALAALLFTRWSLQRPIKTHEGILVWLMFVIFFLITDFAG